MRSPPHQWFHARAPVPLTGREPIMGRLATRLHHRGRGWGWVVLAGPRGAGISRILDEAQRLLEKQGGPPSLRVGLAPAGAPPLEAIRRAVGAVFADASAEDIAHALGAIFPADARQAERLTIWILDGEVLGARPPTAAVVRRTLRALGPG
ncbi:MAG: hypothetical protein ACC662_03170, partial [Planctomycetota bacterium]